MSTPITSLPVMTSDKLLVALMETGVPLARCAADEIERLRFELSASRNAAFEEAAAKVEALTEPQRERAVSRGFLVPRCPLAAAIRELKDR